MSNINRQRGKSLERHVAKDLGGERIGILGHDDVVIHHGGFSLECKERKRVPVFVTNAMTQAINAAERRGYRAAVVVHQLGDRHEDGIVFIRYKDFRDILQRLQREENR